jgi:hypothetical protein
MYTHRVARFVAVATAIACLGVSGNNSASARTLSPRAGADEAAARSVGQTRGELLNAPWIVTRIFKHGASLPVARPGNQSCFGGVATRAPVGW